MPVTKEQVEAVIERQETSRMKEELRESQRQIAALIEANKLLTNKVNKLTIEKDLLMGILVDNCIK